MTALLLDPHGDDAVLFAAYTCLRFRPLIIVTHRTVPFEEVHEGAYRLGCQVISIAETSDRAEHLRSLYGEADKVYAPAYATNGHEEHNEVAGLAATVYGPGTSSYLTYAPRGERQRDGFEVKPTPDEIRHKLFALAAFPSQIEQESTRPWFYELLDMREWVS